jgi:hypothetical protein
MGLSGKRFNGVCGLGPSEALEHGSPEGIRVIEKPFLQGLDKGGDRKTELFDELLLIRVVSLLDLRPSRELASMEVGARRVCGQAEAGVCKLDRVKLRGRDTARWEVGARHLLLLDEMYRTGQ